jgi:hypothetical protein
MYICGFCKNIYKNKYLEEILWDNCCVLNSVPAFYFCFFTINVLFPFLEGGGVNAVQRTAWTCQQTSVLEREREEKEKRKRLKVADCVGNLYQPLETSME